MRRTALVLVLLVAALGLVAAGCGGEEQQSATPETVTGEVTTDRDGDDRPRPRTRARRRPERRPRRRLTTETTPAAPKGDPVAGKEIFLGPSGCTGCHTLADAGSSGNVGPNLDDAQPSFDLAYDRVTNGQGGMPSFGTSLTEQQRADVAAYVSSVAGK